MDIDGCSGRKPGACGCAGVRIRGGGSEAAGSQESEDWIDVSGEEADWTKVPAGGARSPADMPDTVDRLPDVPGEAGDWIDLSQVIADWPEVPGVDENRSGMTDESAEWEAMAAIEGDSGIVMQEAAGRTGEAPEVSAEVPDESDIITNTAEGIPDVGLYHCILQGADRNGDKILTTEEAESVKEIRIHYAVKDYTGLSSLTSLSSIDFGWYTVAGYPAYEGNRESHWEDEGVWESFFREIESLADLCQIYNVRVHSDGVLAALAEKDTLQTIDMKLESGLTGWAELEKLSALEQLQIEASNVDSWESMPGKVRESVKRLKLTYSSVSQGGSFEGALFPNLTYLYLTGKIVSVSGLEQLSDLGYLYIDNSYYNSDGGERVEINGNLPTALRELGLYHCKIPAISDTSVPEMQNLISLALSDVGLQSLDGLTEEQQKQISYLHLADNMLPDVSIVGKMTQLHTLDLGNNQVTVLPELKELTRLERLYLNGNQLTSLPELDQLAQLTCLDLSNNSLTTLPDLSGLTRLGEGYTSKLSCLNVSGNQLDKEIVSANVPKQFSDSVLWMVKAVSGNVDGQIVYGSLSSQEIVVLMAENPGSRSYYLPMKEDAEAILDQGLIETLEKEGKALAIAFLDQNGKNGWWLAQYHLGGNYPYPKAEGGSIRLSNLMSVKLSDENQKALDEMWKGNAALPTVHPFEYEDSPALQSGICGENRVEVAQPGSYMLYFYDRGLKDFSFIEDVGASGGDEEHFVYISNCTSERDPETGKSQYNLVENMNYPSSKGFYFLMERGAVFEDVDAEDRKLVEDLLSEDGTVPQLHCFQVKDDSSQMGLMDRQTVEFNKDEGGSCMIYFYDRSQRKPVLISVKGAGFTDAGGGLVVGHDVLISNYTSKKDPETGEQKYSLVENMNYPSSKGFYFLMAGDAFLGEVDAADQKLAEGLFGSAESKPKIYSFRIKECIVKSGLLGKSSVKVDKPGNYMLYFYDREQENVTLVSENKASVLTIGGEIKRCEVSISNYTNVKDPDTGEKQYVLEEEINYPSTKGFYFLVEEGYTPDGVVQTPAPGASDKPDPAVTPEPDVTAKPSATPVPSAEPSAAPSPTPTAEPTATPEPTEEPSAAPEPGKSDPEVIKDVVKSEEAGEIITDKIKNEYRGKVSVAVDKSLVLQEQIFQDMLENSKNLSVSVVDENNAKLYEWSFRNVQLDQRKFTDLDLSVKFETEKQEEIQEITGQKDAFYMSFGHSGELPAPATMTVYVGSQYKDGDIVYLYYYRPESEKVEAIGVSSGYQVKNGYVTYTITHCSIYFFTGEKLPEAEETEETGSLVHFSGKSYYYEDGEMAASREAYVDGAWRWFDEDGTMAVSKEAYLRSYAGPYADNEDGTGKWVRYDENGVMIKGEYVTADGKYRYDQETGAMVKGWYTDGNGTGYYYDWTTGLLLYGEREVDGIPFYSDPATGAAADCVWRGDFWYEKGMRQGLEGRGREIYDPVSDAWCWLDAVDGGRKAAGKDVYQESLSAYPDREDGTGKWVRYDQDGRMVKGWQKTEAGTYFFEEITGAMAKGHVVIDGREYYFDEITGILRD